MAELSLSSVDQRLDGVAEIDVFAAKPRDERRVSVAVVTNDLPEPGRFYGMAVKSGGGGYPGANLTFNSPVDFSKHDVLAVWFKTESPITYFEIVLNGADGVLADHGLFAAAVPPASRLQTGIWYRVYIPYKVNRCEIRPAGKQMDFSQIKGLTFYTFDESLSLKQPVYNYSFGGMTLLSMDEAKAKFPLTLRRPPLNTAARIVKDDDCLIWTADAGEKIWKDTPLPKRAPRASAASATAAGHEYASLLHVVKPSRNLTSVTAEAGDLMCGKNRIVSTNITVRYVDSIPGLFLDSPDPLPLLNGKSLSVRAGENLQIWTTVYVPAQTPAGTYSGRITLKDSQGLSKSLPLKVQVYGFSLPAQTHLQSAFTVMQLYAGPGGSNGPKCLEERSERYWGRRIEAFSKDYVTLLNNIIRDHGEHRITPEIHEHRMPSESYNIWKYTSWYSFLGEEGRLALHRRYGFDPVFVLGVNIANAYAAAEPLTPEKRAALLNHWKSAGEKLKAAGVAELAAIKIDDEPGAERLKYSVMAAQDAKAAIPYIQNFFNFGGRDLPEALCGYVDTWCPAWGPFDFEGKQAKERKAAGDRFWTYGVEYKSSDAYEPLELRVPYWLYWKYGITGVHYSVHLHKTFLYYPNDTYPHSDGLEQIPSIRWEMIRHGVQDHECLWMLNDLIQKNGKKGDRYRGLLEVQKSLAVNAAEFTHDPRVLLLQRDRVARAIETLQSTAADKRNAKLETGE